MVAKKMSKFFDDTMSGIREAAKAYGSIRKMAEAADMNPSTVSRWLAEDRGPNLRELSNLMDIIGAKILFRKDRIEDNQSKNQEEQNIYFAEKFALEDEIVGLKLQIKILQETLRMPMPTSPNQAQPTDGDSGKEQLSLISEQEKACKAG